MRMDQGEELTAARIIATYSRDDLARVLADLGEEPHAYRIADAIVGQRDTPAGAPQTSAQLVEVIREALPQRAMRHGGNPAKRTFQALRIAVNGELNALRQALPQAINLLAQGGRIVVLSYHSLEDRIVKSVFRAGAESSAPPGLPVEPEETKPYLRLLTRGAEKPCPEELAGNPRSASARLRAAQKIRRAA
jgi:16S rRNA (cytosine1402-N4)-methyltransferase